MPAGSRVLLSVHPRMRGERPGSIHESPVLAGSSPHTRGTSCRGQGSRAGRRFIPAYAGNAASSALRRSCAAVHPRIRGERITDKRTGLVHDGSSPHTRGTRYCTNNECETFRFIPAYAGNARSPRGRRSRPSVHPRIRGERSVAPCQGSVSSGSSPHTRGTHRRADRIAQHHRFIPAYAGNARSWCARQTLVSVHPRIRGERTSSKLLIYRMKSEPSDSTKRSGC